MVADAADLARSVTTVAVALLTLVGAVVVAVGLVRAWRHRRRPQVVVEDVLTGAGLSDDDAASSSARFRQLLRRGLMSQREDATRAVQETIEEDIRCGLLRTGSALTVGALASSFRTSTEHSLDTLAAGVQALAPDRAAGFLAALGSLLPAQRGWQVRARVVRSVDGPVPRIGLTVEVGRLGRPSEDVETFWLAVDSPPGASSDEFRTAALVERLLVPASLWSATRLVYRQLRATDPPTLLVLSPGRTPGAELTGLQLQLAGQLALYASRAQHGFDRTFAQQALADTAEAERLLPYYSRPHQVAAESLERLGWSYRLQREPGLAGRQFARAVGRYERAEAAIGASKAVAEQERQRRLTRLRLRRIKCLLLSDDPAHRERGRSELETLAEDSWPEAHDLYNASCLFALAADPEQQVAVSPDRAWRLLAMALLAYGTSQAPWQHCLTDEELSVLDLDRRKALVGHLRALGWTRRCAHGRRAERVVEEALAASVPAPAPPTDPTARPTPDVALPL